MSLKNSLFQHFQVLELPTYHDLRGSLTVLEEILPFSINRIYWIYGSDGRVRGGHRHHSTRQAMIALNGEVSVFLNDGSVSGEILLNTPNKCLLIEPKDWHVMNLRLGSVLLVIASTLYDAGDYIDEPYI